MPAGKEESRMAAALDDLLKLNGVVSGGQVHL